MSQIQNKSVANSSRPNQVIRKASSALGTILELLEVEVDVKEKKNATQNVVD